MIEMAQNKDKVIFNLMGSDITETQIKNLLNIVQDNRIMDCEMNLDSQAEEYLDRPDYNQNVTCYHEHESFIMRYCAYEMVKRNFNIEEECWFKESHHSLRATRIPALYDTLTLKKNPKNTTDRVKIPKKAHFFCKHKKTDCKWVISFVTWEGCETDITVSTTASDDKIKDFFEDIDTFFATEGPLKGACFNPKWEWVEPASADWDSVILPESVRESLDLNVVNFIQNLDLYENHGLPTSRGILLAGLPGTGKTLTMEVLLNEFEGLTRIYAPAETLSHHNAINDTYILARKLSPTLVIIEDIDTLGQSEDHHDRTIYVSQLLSSLNSAESNKGVITIASTNYPQSLDIALRDRPGRFDARINFLLPTKDERERILRKYASPFKISDIKWSKWANRTENFTGAWLRELVTMAFSLAVREQKGNKKPVLKNKYMEGSFVIVEKTRNMVNKERQQEKESETAFM